jgi:hypothetical protein
MPTLPAICPEPAVRSDEIDRLWVRLAPQVLLILPIPGRSPSIATYHSAADLYRYCGFHDGQPTRAALGRLRANGFTSQPEHVIIAKRLARWLVAFPRLTARVRWDVVAALSPVEREQFADRLVVVWPDSVEERRLHSFMTVACRAAD